MRGLRQHCAWITTGPANFIKCYGTAEVSGRQVANGRAAAGDGAIVSTAMQSFNSCQSPAGITRAVCVISPPQRPRRLPSPSGWRPRDAIRPGSPPTLRPRRLLRCGPGAPSRPAQRQSPPAAARGVAGGCRPRPPRPRYRRPLCPRQCRRCRSLLRLQRGRRCPTRRR